jgi:hypothetical protein
MMILNMIGERASSLGKILCGVLGDFGTVRA